MKQYNYVDSVATMLTQVRDDICHLDNAMYELDNRVDLHENKLVNVASILQNCANIVSNLNERLSAIENLIKHVCENKTESIK